jgi:hypothetical protein
MNYDFHEVDKTQLAPFEKQPTPPPVVVFELDNTNTSQSNVTDDLASLISKKTTITSKNKTAQPFMLMNEIEEQHSSDREV